MTMLVRKGGSWRTITGAYVFANGSWRQLVAIKVRAGGQWRTVANFTAPPAPPPGGSGSGGGGGGTLSLLLSATIIRGSAAGGSITTSDVTVTPSGGAAPYTYSWSVVSSDGFTVYNCTSSTTATTAAHAASVNPGVTDTCTIHCVVTDSLGTTATSGNVTASFTNTLSP